MKLPSLLIGLVAGAVIGFLLTIEFKTNNSQTKNEKAESQFSDTTIWKWADSLDAVKAAPQNHKIVFENDQIRILEVILKPYEFEQMHTHRLSSVMFGSGNPSPFDIIYYRYGYDSISHTYFIKDSNTQHNDASINDTSYAADLMKPEGPHRVKNLSNVTIDIFRVEFKTGLKK